MCKQDRKFSTTVKMFSAQHVFNTLNKNESGVLFSYFPDLGGGRL